LMTAFVVVPKCKEETVAARRTDAREVC